MAHEHKIYDPDRRFKIDVDTRTVATTESNVPVLIQFDHDSEYITFEADRHVEGHDLSLCNKVEVHYINTTATGGLATKGVYEATDLRVDPDDSSKVIFTWVISRNATMYAGPLNFVVAFSCLDEGVLLYRWNTLVNSNLTISKGIDNSEAVTQTYADVLEMWKLTLFGIGDTEEYRMLATSEAQQNAIEAKGAATLASIPDNYSALQKSVDDLYEGISEYVEPGVKESFVKSFEHQRENLIDLTQIIHGDVKVTGKDWVDVINPVSDVEVYVPVNVVAGRSYWFKCDFDASETANVRLYDENKTLLYNAVSGEAKYFSVTTNLAYVRIFCGASGTLRVSSLILTEHITDTSIDKTLRADLVPEAALENHIATRRMLDVTIEAGGLYTDGTLNDAATIRRIKFNVKAGFIYNNDKNMVLEKVSYFSADGAYLGQEKYATSWFKSPYDGYAYAVSLVAYNVTGMFESRESFKSIPDLYDELMENAGGNPGGTSQVINTTEVKTVVTRKETVETHVDKVSSARDASLYGVLPSNDGVSNSFNMQALLNVGGDIVLDVPGVYEFADTLVIYSDTSLIFGKGVYCKRTTNSNGFLINAGAKNGIYDENITISGLNIICNGIDSSTAGSVFGLNGHIGLYRVHNVRIDNITCEDLGVSSYFIHIARYENVIIDGIRVTGGKDGVHSSCGKGLIVRNGVFATEDDPIALNAHDYQTGCPELDWIEDVLVENCTVLPTTTTSFFARILAGSWSDWASGNKYQYNDTIVASNGKLYRRAGTPADAEAVSTVEPGHEIGVVTGSDGIQWRYIQNDIAYAVGCRNVTFRNIHIQRESAMGFSMHLDTDNYSRSYYPGSNLVGHSNIVFDGIYCDSPVATFIHAKTPFDHVRILNSTINSNTVFVMNQPVNTHGIILTNNNVYVRDENFMVIDVYNAGTTVDWYDGKNAILGSGTISTPASVVKK